MESLGKVLHRIADQQPSTDPQREPDLEDEKCHLCGGLEWVRSNVPLGNPAFGKAHPCPVCVEGIQANIDWFAGLKAPTQNYFHAMELCKEMAQNPSGWLVLHGGVGSGKTTLAKAILSRWRGKEVEPETSAELLMHWRSHITAEDFEARFMARCEAGAAVIDDLGAEKYSGWVWERLQTYLNWRYRKKSPTVITTNLDREELASHLDERIADRVFDQRTGLVRIVTLDVQSFRTG